MLEHRKASNATDTEFSPALTLWLDRNPPPALALVPHQQVRAGVARLQAVERSLAGMERRLAAAAVRHDQALSLIRARLERLQQSVGKVAEDQFANGKSLDRLLSGLASRIAALEAGGGRARRRFSVRGTPQRAA